MNYLYGDSTPSQLKSNFLEFLRDALDFCVFVLQADSRIKQGKVEIRKLSERADAESARLDRFIKSVSHAVEQGDKGDAESPTSRCGARIYSLIADTYRASLEGIRQTLSDAIARIDAEEAAGRDACLTALGELLAPHDPPNAKVTVRLAVGSAGHYVATVDGTSEPAMAWTLALAIPEGHAWSSLMRVERVVPHLEIRAPQLAGWITKEVKTKAQRLERHLITSVVGDHETLSFELRLEPALDAGFDFAVDIDRGTVRSMRVSPADDQSAGPFELEAADLGAIIELARKIRTGLADLQRQPSVTATVAGVDFAAVPTYVDFVASLVGMMAPIVTEISQRSLTPNELVLRRALSDDRREEIFVAKVTLREKLAILAPDLRALFAPLGLDPAGAPPAAKPAEPPPNDRPAVRSELPPSPGSVPPPPMLPIPAIPPPPKAYLGGTGPAAPRPVRPPAATLAAAPAPPSPGSTPPQSQGKSPSDAPQMEVTGEEEVELSQDDIVPDSERSLAVSSLSGEKRNEVLISTLKKIMTLSKNGRAIEAYHEYAALFSSATFADYKKDDQRQALKLLVLAKTAPLDPDAVVSAHRAALPRILALVEDSREAADHELLGVAHLALGDEKSATAAFQAGLDIERVRNPQSDLIASLMRRVSQL